MPASGNTSMVTLPPIAAISFVDQESVGGLAAISNFQT
jgi:hypothetical protein